MMNNSKKSLIDNWSLEQAGALLDSDSDYFSLAEEEFLTSLGGLSNYINSIFLYDETNYLANGFEKDWVRFEWFQKNAKLLIQPINPEGLNIDWSSNESYSDIGIKNYLISSKQFNTDLFVSPQRAERIIDIGVPKIESNFEQTLNSIDERIKSEKNSLWFEDVKIGIDRNFIFPSFTHYVLSQAKNSEDLLTVIMQMKEDGKINRVRKRIDEIATSTKESSKFQKYVEGIIREQFGKSLKTDKPWSINIPVLFLAFTKSFTLDFFKRKEHLLFLKGIIACRTETQGLYKNIERIFKRKIVP